MRIQVNLSEKMVAKLDKIADDMGVSRSALCSTILGSYVMSQEKTFDVLKSIGIQAINDQEQK